MTANVSTTRETVFFPANVDEHFVSKSLTAEVHGGGVSFVEETIHEPCSQEGEPPEGDHHPDLVLCQLMRKAIDVEEPHVGGHTCQSGYSQPASRI